ncbi:imidazoleglycerol-phosphate synthase Ecym_2250 [Eremothecium cymbalariae DBVPG|uniref:Imidazole glycerol phosphate synthase hisHF n=1 Tax=Eremothecium cymbalariae (strain CBS 270.75 / DBVPG 7215 / KCTC 17166 / NRRL Y-17582) TaxID=931890 RepID=G8JPP1_ERECY|nr:Hypothetical protein Ecym_2250 [Eremothecium cymbalariae DBVPG\
MGTVHVIDLRSGNLQSISNAIEHLGYKVRIVTSAQDAELERAEKLILPGVGNFGHFIDNMNKYGFLEPIKDYITSGRLIMGICVGLQALFSSSEESAGCRGLDLIDIRLCKFKRSKKPVPQIGWNSVNADDDLFFGLDPLQRYYFVHSYAAILKSNEEREYLRKQGWKFATASYGEEEFVAAVYKGNVFATQFHPEKSGTAGLEIIRNFLRQQHPIAKHSEEDAVKISNDHSNYGLSRRIIACLDVRTNDDGDLVVTKGDQYDVREKSVTGNVRNLGKPVELAQRYYEQGADEVTFLNITSYRNCPLRDSPMLEVLRLAAKTVFVPLTVGGGIKDVLDVDGTAVSALDVAALYFRSGADKVSIGTDAVYAAEKYYALGGNGDETSPIETISKAYGVQAVVISVDPRKIYINGPADTNNKAMKTRFPNDKGQTWCWYQCTIKGGREARDIGVWELTRACEALGAGEILLNSIDKDGTNSGYDLELIEHVKQAVSIPVIASSGAGIPEHFEQAFKNTGVDACLGAGMFHRGAYTVHQVKEYLSSKGLKVRI